MLEKQQIIISYYRQGISQRQIAKTLHISRKTVKKYILQYKEERDQSGDEQGIVLPPKYDTSSRSKIKLTDSVIEYIERCLEKNDQKRSTGWAKQCMANTDIHEALIKNGYDIGYTTVCNYVRQYRQKQQAVYIRQTYDPGSQVEFDWGYVKLKIGGKQKNLMLAVFTLAYSNHRWARLFYRQDMPSFLQAHVLYFNQINGIPKQVVYDNMKTAVAKFTIRQSDKKPTQDLLRISTYYQFDFRFCNAGKGNEKGHVEKSVEYVRRKSFCDVDGFCSLDDANQHLDNIVRDLNSRCVKRKKTSIKEDLLLEHKHFAHLPVTDYDIAVVQSYKMDKYHTISVDTNQYSVPESVTDPTVNVKVFPAHIHIYDSTNKCVARHQRLHAKYEWVINIDHYWKSLHVKPGALPHSTAMKQAPPLLKEVYYNYYHTIPKVFIELILYCKQNKITIEELMEATILCRQKCLNTPLTTDKVILLIQSLKPKTSPAQVVTLKQDAMCQDISNNCLDLLQQVQAQIL